MNDSIDYKQLIHKKFYNINETEHPMALTVGELKVILNELPDDLSIDNDFMYPVVVNIGRQCGATHLRFSDEDAWIY